MSGVSIPNLPPAISVSGNEEIEIVQNGTSRRATVSQVFTSAVTSVSFGTTGFTPSSPTIGNVVVSGTLNVANGGTGGTNATDARTNLSAAKSGVNTDITQLGGLGNGSLSAPSLTFSSETNTGLYKSGAGDLSVSILGAQIGTFSSTGLAITGSLSMSRLNLTDSVTGTASTSTINAATTWNTTGTPTAWKLNVTDTASNASSLLMDLQVGGSSRLSVRKDGVVVSSGSAIFGNASATAIEFIGSPGSTLAAITNAGGTGAVNGLVLRNTSVVAYSSSVNPTGAVDLILARDAANTLAQRNGTNAQSFRVYNTFTDASNYERLSVSGAGTSFRIAGEAAGTGASRSIVFDTVAGGGGIVFATGGTSRWTVSSSAGAGHFIASADNTYDIGLSGANRPRRLYLGGGSLTGSAADSSVEINPTWNTTGTPTAVKLNVTDTASNANSLLMDLQVGGSSVFSVSKAGAFGIPQFQILPDTGLYGRFLFSGAERVRIGSSFLEVNSGGQIRWSSTGNPGSPDTILSRKAAANLQLGAADAAAPVAQSLSVQSVVAGTTNVAGANFTINGSQGTGTGAGGAIILRTAAAGTSGSAQNALAERMRITSAGDVGIGTSSPTARLTTVAGASQAGIYAQGGSGSLAADFLNSNATSFGVRINGGQNGYYALSVSDRVSNNLFYVDGGGNIGIGGVTSPNYKLHVAGRIASTDATAGIGYGTGAGGTVTQATSRTTGVTLNKTTGSITLVSAAGTTAWQSFTVTNSAVAVDDTVIVNQRSGTDLYMIHVTNVAAGSFQITFATTGGTTTEQPVFNFAVIKGATT